MNTWSLKESSINSISSYDDYLQLLPLENSRKRKFDVFFFEQYKKEKADYRRVRLKFKGILNPNSKEYNLLPTSPISPMVSFLDEIDNINTQLHLKIQLWSKT